MTKDERHQVAKEVREFRAYLRRRFASDPKSRREWLQHLRRAVRSRV
jgi:hypothetical protein